MMDENGRMGCWKKDVHTTATLLQQQLNIRLFRPTHTSLTRLGDKNSRRKITRTEV